MTHVSYLATWPYCCLSAGDGVGGGRSPEAQPTLRNSTKPAPKCPAAKPLSKIGTATQQCAPMASGNQRRKVIGPTTRKRRLRRRGRPVACANGGRRRFHRRQRPRSPKGKCERSSARRPGRTASPGNSRGASRWDESQKRLSRPPVRIMHQHTAKTGEGFGPHDEHPAHSGDLPSELTGVWPVAEAHPVLVGVPAPEDAGPAHQHLRPSSQNRDWRRKLCTARSSGHMSQVEHGPSHSRHQG